VVQHYHITALHYLRQAVMAGSAERQQDAPLSQLLLLTDHLQQLDWRQQAQQHQAQLLLSQLASLVGNWQQPGKYWPLARRLLVGVLLQGLHSSSAAVRRSLQAVTDGLVRALYAVHVRETRRKGLVHFMHVSKSAGGSGAGCAMTAERGVGVIPRPAAKPRIRLAAPDSRCRLLAAQGGCGSVAQLWAPTRNPPALAGTTMCLAAEANGCTTQNFTMTFNCRISAFWDTPAWTTQALIPTAKGPAHPFYYRQPQELQRQQHSCAARRKELERNCWSFYANELYLPCGIVDGGSSGSSGSSGSGSSGGGPHSERGRSLKAQPSFGVGALNSELSTGSSSGSGSGDGRPESNGSAGSNEAGSAGSAAAAAVDTGSCLCHDVANVIIVRDPLKRAMAHLKHIAAHHIQVGSNLWRNSSYLMETSHMTVGTGALATHLPPSSPGHTRPRCWTVVSSAAGGSAQGLALHGAAFRALCVSLQAGATNGAITAQAAAASAAPATAQVNNYYVRSLLGASVFWLPQGQVSQPHMDQALLVLQQFDTIALLEDAQGTDMALQQGLGWAVGLNGIKQQNTRGTSFKLNMTLLATAQLIHQNRHDIRLYYHAWALHSMDVAFLSRASELAGGGAAGGGAAGSASQAPCGLVGTRA
jgi:uncharacterized protein YceK